MKTTFATLSALGATLILAAAPALAQDTATTTPLDLQVKTQLQTQTRTQTQSHRMLQDGSGAMQGRMGGGAARSGGQGGR